MDTSASKFYLLLFLLSTLIVCSSGSFFSTANQFLHKQLNKPLLVQTAQHDNIETPITTLPTTPLTNPVTTPATGTGTVPPGFFTPPIVTIPSADPAAPITFPLATPNPITPPITITIPVTTPSTTIPSVNPTVPITFPPATPNPPVPITNPVTTPSTTIPVVPQPVTIPVTTYPAPTVSNDPTTTPVPPGTTTTNAPTVPVQNWCVVKSGVSEMAIQVGLDYACGFGGADCSAIQQGASCYNPNSLQNHASYAFNSYYQRNPVQTSCDFGGTAMITNVNPSSGYCVFTTGSSSSTPTPTTTSYPVTTTSMPTPTTESSSRATPSGSDTPPTRVLNSSSPDLGGGITGNGERPPTANISSASSSPSSFQPFLGYIIVMTLTIITGMTVLNV